METTLRILTRKYLFFLTYLLSFSLYSQSPSELSKQNYREDQFYFGSSYFIQSESIQDFKQNGFSGNFQFGFIRDFPLNNNSTRAIGVGVGYERNFFTSNIQPIIENSEINYRIIVSKFLESKNKLSFSSIVIPIEYRWRTSKIDEFKFWRIYSGFKLKKNFPLYSNPSYGTELKIDEIEDWTSSIYLNAGYNTWNISLEYDLNPLIKNKKTIDGNNLNVSFFRLGLIFYIL
ncbi:MAG: outer membrane beta-barrel protein [Cryomorphaceae bacterium]|nr:outer membrane beta-barrel protein [Cryomorphaceae bacterium]MBT7383740.1 outer membrane beta-barrel protein [Cryomorphaceae bacterium]MBT7546773.1 outer membrane beta-barrel protein [Cryomorphaceae bacterium]MDG1888962.1 outer membrane beta-barrel protein [Flavobacteriaceae bacterium]